MSVADAPVFLSRADLLDAGLSVEEVQRLCRGAVEYTALDGQPCWARDELVDRWALLYREVQG